MRENVCVRFSCRYYVCEEHVVVVRPADREAVKAMTEEELNAYLIKEWRHWKAIDCWPDLDDRQPEDATVVFYDQAGRIVKSRPDEAG